MRFLTYSNCWIGLGAAAFAWKYYIITAKVVNYPIISFIFFSTILTYSFQRFVKLNDSSYGNSQRFDWMKRNPILLKLTLLISSIGTIWGLFFLNLNSFYLLAFLGFLSFFYIIKIPGLSNLRNIPFIKIFIIAIVWAGTSSLLPAINTESFDWNSELIQMLITDFVFVLAITIPFDIRDLIVDEDTKKTIPQVLGSKWALIFATALIITTGFLIYPLVNGNAIFIALALLTSAVLIAFTNKKRNDLYFSFWMDGLLILLPLTIYLAIL